MAASEPVSRPLWPDGAPFFKAEADSDRPKLIHYPVPEAVDRTGASIVICPGGGYGGLAIDHEGHQLAQFFNALGIDAHVLHYRLGSRGYHYPVQLADVQRAIRLVRHEAKTREDLDPGRIGVIGFSAGGHLASMAATLFERQVHPPGDAIDGERARPDFAILAYPVISMVEDGLAHQGSRRNLLGKELVDDPEVLEEKARSVSSELHVTAQTPPTFLFHTTEDVVVSPINSLRFYEALVRQGVAAELHVYQRGPHGVGLYRGDPETGSWSGHLVDWMRNLGVMSGPFETTAIKGTLSLDGEPVAWGVVNFEPINPHQPRRSFRVRNGRFEAGAEAGPVIGPNRVRFEASIWERTRDPADRVIRLDRLTPQDPEPLTLTVEDSNPEPLTLDFTLMSR